MTAQQLAARRELLLAASLIGRPALTRGTANADAEYADRRLLEAARAFVQSHSERLEGTCS